MRIPIIVRGACAALVLGALVAACHDPDSKLPTTPSAPSLVSVDIGGPATVEPGHSVQLVANAHMSDGSIKAVTSGTAITWRILDPGLATITPGGVLTAGQTRGERLISVDVGLNTVIRHATRTQLILPNGTFRVVGTVKEADAPTPPVIGARVEVPGDISTTTDTGGQYRLYGVLASSDIQVSATGYATEVRHVTLSANSTENFLLQLDGPRLGLNGNFTLAIDVPASCSSSPALSAGLRHRAYDASVSQSGSTINVALTEPRFRLNSLARGNQFSGRALGGGATFTLDWYDSYYYPYYGPTSYPQIAEALPDGTYLVASGEAVVSGTPAGLSGTLAGGVVQWDSRFPASSSRILGACFGTVQFGLTAR